MFDFCPEKWYNNGKNFSGVVVRVGYVLGGVVTATASASVLIKGSVIWRGSLIYKLV